MSSIFKRFPGPTPLLFGLLALLGSMPAPPAQAGGPSNLVGDPCHPPGRQTCGHPITLPTGNVYEKVTDYTTVGQHPLAVTRYYNSSAAGVPVGSFGNWLSTYDRRLDANFSVTANRPDGNVIVFFPDGSGGWKGFSDLDFRLTQSGSTWTLTDWDDNVETYTFNGFNLVLTSIKARGGYTQTLHYDPQNPFQPSSVTDSYGRTLTIAYNSNDGNGVISSVTTPDGLVLSYNYIFNPKTNSRFVLTKVGYSTNPATSLSYLYEDTHFLNTEGTLPLTGIIDENGNRFASWTYDDTRSVSLATSSQYAGGANLTTVAYDSNGNPTVTQVLGVQEFYNFSYFQTDNHFVTVPINTEIDRVAPAAVRKFTYDSNGYVASETDWNGNLTTFVNNARGLPKKITEAAGTPLAGRPIRPGFRRSTCRRRSPSRTGPRSSPMTQTAMC